MRSPPESESIGRSASSEVRELERARDRRFVGGRDALAEAAMRQAAERDELAHGQRPARLRRLREVGDRARPLGVGEHGERAILPAHARVGRGDARECPQQARLAGAVRADQADELAAFEPESQRLHGDLCAMADLKTVGAETHAVLRCCEESTMCRKNGAPRSAVTTPSLSSGPGGMSRMAMSAASVSAAPARKLGRSNRLGR